MLTSSSSSATIVPADSSYDFAPSQQQQPQHLISHTTTVNWHQAVQSDHAASDSRSPTMPDFPTSATPTVSLSMHTQPIPSMTVSVATYRVSSAGNADCPFVAGDELAATSGCATGVQTQPSEHRRTRARPEHEPSELFQRLAGSFTRHYSVQLGQLFQQRPQRLSTASICHEQHDQPERVL